MPVRRESLFFIAFVSLCLVPSLSGSPESDELINFKSSLENNVVLASWNNSALPCDGSRPNWVGVLCLNGTVYGLQLEHMGLSGTIDVNSLHRLPYLRSLSLMDNNFEGGFPNFNILGKLKALYLSNNMFSGDIPDDAFRRMSSLKVLFLANNQFTGTIPSSLTTLPKLAELKLEGNQFHGEIPPFRQEDIKVNVASNELVGQIPASLSKLNPSSFAGNKALCGQPLASCNTTAPTSSPLTPPIHHQQGSFNGDHTMILIILLVVVTTLVVVIAALILFCRKNTVQESDRTELLMNDSNKFPTLYGETDEMREARRMPLEPSGGGHARKSEHNDNHQLSFLRNDCEKFDLQDLLKASAEVLGSGTFGASYKAVVVADQPVVVKRYRHMNNAGREEFHEHMRRIGRLNHPNLLPLVAYYYKKDERLLVTEFVENGSLASHLHGNHSFEKEGLDWATRLRIVKGIVKGLAYLYQELPMTVPHGHLKSSNVLLDDSYEPLLVDYALRPVVNPEHAHMVMIAYKSPEYSLESRTSSKTDIWSLGILILEILTARFPENYLTPGFNKNADLATWVNTMVKEKRTSDVFDKAMTGTKDSKGELINLLKVGLSCCEEDVEQRLDINEVVKQIEQINNGDDLEEKIYVSELTSSAVKHSDDEIAFSLDR